MCVYGVYASAYKRLRTYGLMVSSGYWSSSDLLPSSSLPVVVIQYATSTLIAGNRTNFLSLLHPCSHIMILVTYFVPRLPLSLARNLRTSAWLGSVDEIMLKLLSTHLVKLPVSLVLQRSQPGQEKRVYTVRSGQFLSNYKSGDITFTCDTMYTIPKVAQILAMTSLTGLVIFT